MNREELKTFIKLANNTNYTILISVMTASVTFTSFKNFA